MDKSNEPLSDSDLPAGAPPAFSLLTSAGDVKEVRSMTDEELIYFRRQVPEHVDGFLKQQAAALDNLVRMSSFAKVFDYEIDRRRSLKILLS
jgi:hypothetical protein